MKGVSERNGGHKKEGICMDIPQPISITPPVIPKLCSECGGERMLYNVGPEIVAYTQNTRFDTQRQFWTCICTNCGQTTFYLREPEKPPTKKSTQPLGEKKSTESLREEL